MNTLDELLTSIRACDICKSDLPLGPRPILAAHLDSKILIVGQAPGIRVHQSGVAWNDPSGERLRKWMDISSDDFYDPNKVAIVPMGFCYPGTGKSGDLPPRKECSQQWHSRLISQLKHVELTLLIGIYAQRYILGEKCKATLTANVQQWQSFGPEYLPMPHPSPRNNRWLQKNSFFEEQIVPHLQARIKRIL